MVKHVVVIIIFRDKIVSYNLIFRTVKILKMDSDHIQCDKQLYVGD